LARTYCQIDIDERRTLPRHCEPEALARAHLRRLADRLNDTPREVFRQHLAAPPGLP
jgi:hypothetical protein